MKIEYIRTFLEIADCGNFNRAAENLNVTQSTVSARVKTIEDSFGQKLFTRGHAGVELTHAGHAFRDSALGIQRLWQQAQHSINLPSGYRSAFGLGSQASLWERPILRWIPWMREQVPDVALRVEADYSPSLMRQLIDGLLDVGVMYQPRRTPGLVVEPLFDETLVLVDTERRELSDGWVENYVFVDWGDVFRAAHIEHFPDIHTSAVSVGLGGLGLAYILQNGGSGYFPLRVVDPLISEGKLFRVDGSPEMTRPAYMVYPETPRDAVTMDAALTGLRRIAERAVPE